MKLTSNFRSNRSSFALSTEVRSHVRAPWKSVLFLPFSGCLVAAFFFFCSVRDWVFVPLVITCYCSIYGSPSLHCPMVIVHSLSWSLPWEALITGFFVDTYLSSLLSKAFSHRLLLVWGCLLTAIQSWISYPHHQRGWLVTVVFWPFAHGSLVSHTNLFESSFPSRLSCSWFSWLHHERLPILTAFLHLTSSWFSLGVVFFHDNWNY